MDNSHNTEEEDGTTKQVITLKAKSKGFHEDATKIYQRNPRTSNPENLKTLLHDLSTNGKRRRQMKETS